MAEVVPPDSGALAPEIYVLNLAGTDRFSWRLRSAPCMNADEVAEFRHGDKIRAVRVALYPGWLKLVDKSGWVKEAHEEQPVWKAAESSSSAQAVELESTSTSDPSECKDAPGFAGKNKSKCSSEDMEDMSPSSAVSSGSQTSSAAQAHNFSFNLPVPFKGKSCRIGDEENFLPAVTSTGTTMRWFTGPSCKIALAPSEISAIKSVNSGWQAAKPRWADMEDTDEEDVDASPRPCKGDVELTFGEKQLNIPVADAVDNVLEPAKMSIVAVEHHADGLVQEPRVLSEPWMAQQVVSKPNRQNRNRQLLQKNNKTQMCKYLAKEGGCPFGDNCWFAHSESTNEEDVNASPGYCKGDVELLSDEKQLNIPFDDAHSSDKFDEEAVDNTLEPAKDTQVVSEPLMAQQGVLKPTRRKRNRELLQRNNKTQMCKYLAKDGVCPFGATCWFAHSENDLKDHGSAKKEASMTNT